MACPSGCHCPASPGNPVFIGWWLLDRPVKPGDDTKSVGRFGKCPKADSMTRPSPRKTAESEPSLPSRVDRLADQSCWVGARARTEFLEAAGVNLGDVEVPLLVRGHAVDAPQRTREAAHGSPRVEHMPVQVVLQHLVRVAIKCRQRPIGADHHKVEA